MHSNACKKTAPPLSFASTLPWTGSLDILLRTLDCRVGRYYVVCQASHNCSSKLRVCTNTHSVVLLTRLGCHKSNPSRGILGESQVCITTHVSHVNVTLSRVRARNASRWRRASRRREGTGTGTPLPETKKTFQTSPLCFSCFLSCSRVCPKGILGGHHHSTDARFCPDANVRKLCSSNKKT